MRQCLFCDRSADSREHGWSNWILTLLRHDETTTSHFQSVRGDERRSWFGPNADLVFKRVCEVCNNGWMSELESETKPVVAPMIGPQARAQRLDTLAQITIASWATKMAMVFDCGRTDRELFYSQHERETFREHLLPPSFTRVWIAGYVGPTVGGYCRGYTVPGVAKHVDRPDGPPMQIDVEVTTLAAGAFAFQIVTARNPSPTDNTVLHVAPQPIHPWPDVCHQIWPVVNDEIRWPPPITLDDVNITHEAFANRWYPT